MNEKTRAANPLTIIQKAKDTTEKSKKSENTEKPKKCDKQLKPLGVQPYNQLKFQANRCK